VNKSKNILITGGAGFIGINLVDYLLETQRYKITVLDSLSGGNYPLLRQVVTDRGGDMEEQFSPSPEKVCFYQIDILDRQSVQQVLKGQDGAVHLAAQTGVIPSQQDPYQDAAVNITGTLNLLCAARDCSLKRFIFASSAAPLGEQTPPLDETKVPAPLAPYGASKLAGESYCSAFCGSYGLDTTVLRFSNIYGPNSFHKGSVVALFIKKLLKMKPLTVYGDGEQTRDFLYAGDIVRIIDTILQSNPQSVKGQLFQLGTGVETSVNRLIELLKQVTGLIPEMVYEPERSGEIKRNYTSIKKITRLLGYRPQFDLLQGLEKTWHWFKTRDSAEF
jgi:UDP-glucose 4-epimerase